MKIIKLENTSEVPGHVTCTKCGETVPKELDLQSMCESCRLAQLEINSAHAALNAFLWKRHRDKKLTGKILIELTFAESKFVSFHEVPVL